jgi:PAS domain S-box-containing protein
MADRAATILVVDDNPATLYSTSRVLRQAGFRVLEADTGTKAIELASDDVNLVVLDVKLPDIDGFEVCRRLRASPPTARTPVVHLSATFVKDADKVHGLESGAIGYLTHPVEPLVLIATVGAFLRAQRAEDEMRRSEARFRAVFSQALNGIALVDAQLTFLEVNPAMGELLGHAPPDLVGRSLADFLPASAIGRADVIERLCDQSDWRGTFPLQHRDGRFVQVEWSVSTHPLPGVRLVIVTDVSERVRVEEQRQELLASERAARAEAERANRLKDDFLATLSHELRTPLGAIVGWAQVLQRVKPDAAGLAEGLEAIERNAKTQTQLISDLLDVSRITSGKLALELRVVDPAAMIEAALAAIAPAADAKGLRIEKRLAATAGPVQGDASRLQQILWNLMSNAVKFTPKGGRIALDLERAGSQVQISVRDNGQGIKPEFLPYVFERFRQGDARATRVGGLGLGLAIVKHLTEMHGGTVTAESAGEGRGATFTVRLPVAALKPIQQSDEPDQSAAVDTATRLGGLRVVVVDDDPDTRRLLQRILEESQAEARVADGVDAALPVIQDFEPDILVSDIGMPGRDGHDLIREVRARGHTFKTLPAIALTAFARTEERRRALLAGYQVHIAKPVDTNELIAAIASLAGRTG